MVRFRKSKKLGGLRLNLSKSGLGFSTGIKGLRLGWSPHRGTYHSWSIPGTGLYDINYHGTGSNKNKASVNFQPQMGVPSEISKNGIHILWLIFSIICGCVGINDSGFSLINLGFILIPALWIVFVKIPSWDKIIKYQDAKNLFEKGYYDRAIVLFEQLIENYPRMTSLIFMLGDCYFVKGDYNKAISLYQTLPEELKEEVITLTKIATCYYEMEKFQIALEVLLRGPQLKRKMDDAMVGYRYLLGICYEKLGDEEKATNQFNKVYAYNPNFMDISNKV